ncbi:MAG: hypothetical protein HXX13_08735 [Bacteroidetes bacterium]|nr:hypothetical protein [Bacteroidota bacterium]
MKITKVNMNPGTLRSTRSLSPGIILLILLCIPFVKLVAQENGPSGILHGVLHENEKYGD